MTSVQQSAPTTPLTGQLALWQLNLLRIGYVVMGVGLAVFKWPLLFADKPAGLTAGDSCGLSRRPSWSPRR